MANNYLQFSASIADLTPGEKDWVEDLLGASDDLEATCTELGIPMPPDTNAGDSLDFEWEVQTYGVASDGPSDASSMLWLYAEESFDPDHVAWFAQQFLRRFRPLESFTFEWAATCSKPVIGYFSGGAAFVTANGIEFFTTAKWVENKVTEFEMQLGATVVPENVEHS